MHLAERQPAWRHAFNASRGSKRWDDVTGQIRILFEENRADLYALVATGLRGDSVRKGARRNERTLVASSMNIPK